MELAEIGELVPADEAHFSQNTVVAGGRVALAEDKAIPIRRIRVCGIYAHVVEKHAGHQIHRRQRTAGMAAAGIGRHLNDVAAHLTADFGKLFCVHNYLRSCMI